MISHSVVRTDFFKKTAVDVVTSHILPFLSSDSMTALLSVNKKWLQLLHAWQKQLNDLKPILTSNLIKKALLEFNNHNDKNVLLVQSKLTEFASLKKQPKNIQFNLLRDVLITINREPISSSTDADTSFSKDEESEDESNASQFSIESTKKNMLMAYKKIPRVSVPKFTLKMTLKYAVCSPEEVLEYNPDAVKNTIDRNQLLFKAYLANELVQLIRFNSEQRESTSVTIKSDRNNKSNYETNLYHQHQYHERRSKYSTCGLYSVGLSMIVAGVILEATVEELPLPVFISCEILGGIIAVSACFNWLYHVHRRNEYQLAMHRNHESAFFRPAKAPSNKPILNTNDTLTVPLLAEPDTEIASVMELKRPR